MTYCYPGCGLASAAERETRRSTHGLGVLMKNCHPLDWMYSMTTSESR